MDSMASASSARTLPARPIRRDRDREVAWRRGLSLAVIPRRALWSGGVFAAALAMCLVVNLQLIQKLPITGDEPWYLLQGYALVHYHTNNLAGVVHNHHIYAQFLGLVPDDHTHDYLNNGEQVLPNLPGYAALIGPVYFLFGRPGIVVFQAILAAITAVLLFNVAAQVYGSRLSGLFASAAYLLSLPVILYVGQIFPSTVASCATFLGFALVSRRLATAQGWRLAGASIGLGLITLLLPWLHFKYVAVALALLVSAMLALRPRLARRGAGVVDRSAWYAASTMAGLMALSLLLIGLYSRHYYGTWAPQLTPHQEGGVHWQYADPQRAVHLYIDMFLSAQSGLLPWVPLYLLAVPGLVFLWRRSARDGCYAVLILAAQLSAYLTVIVARYVYQGWALPARFTVESAPFLALGVAGAFAFGLPSVRAASAAFVGRRMRTSHLRWGELMRRWRARPADARGELARVGRAGLAVSCLALLAVSAWFPHVAMRDPVLLYGSSAGVRLANKYADALPAWWFGLFPQTPGVVEYATLSRNTLMFDDGGNSPWVDIPAGRFVARVTLSCVKGRDVTPTLHVLVKRRQREGLRTVAERVLPPAPCHGADAIARNTTLRIVVPFASDGYNSMRFSVASPGSATVAAVRVAYAPAQPAGR